jgi:hypothetical protein
MNGVDRPTVADSSMDPCGPLIRNQVSTILCYGLEIVSVDHGLGGLDVACGYRFAWTKG